MWRAGCIWPEGWLVLRAGWGGLDAKGWKGMAGWGGPEMGLAGVGGKLKNLDLSLIDVY